MRLLLEMTLSPSSHGGPSLAPTSLAFFSSPLGEEGARRPALRREDEGVPQPGNERLCSLTLPLQGQWAPPSPKREGKDASAAISLSGEKMGEFPPPWWEAVKGQTLRTLALILAMVAALNLPVMAADESVATTTPVQRKSPAELRADSLDKLFARLRRGPDEAKAAEQGIWKIWMTADSPTAEVLLGQATKALNDKALPQAMAILTRLVGAYPDFAEGWNKRATVFFMIGRDGESLADIERTLDLEPRHFGALSGRGMIYQRQKKYSAAEQAFRDALSVNPALDSATNAIKEMERLERGI